MIEHSRICYNVGKLRERIGANEMKYTVNGYEVSTYEQAIDLLIEMSFSDDTGEIVVEVVF